MPDYVLRAVVTTNLEQNIIPKLHKMGDTHRVVFKELDTNIPNFGIQRRNQDEDTIETDNPLSPIKNVQLKREPHIEEQEAEQCEQRYEASPQKDHETIGQRYSKLRRK